MPLSIEEWKNVAAATQSVATIASFGIGGVWVYSKYIRQQERYPNIEFTADVQLIGVQADYWIAELIAIVDNRGKAQHRMKNFFFDLSAVQRGAVPQPSDRWGGQVDFPIPLASGSFLPAQLDFFFVDPGVKAKYSYIARIPLSAGAVILHCRFKYADARKYGHTAERTVAIPPSEDGAQSGVGRGG